MPVLVYTLDLTVCIFKLQAKVRFNKEQVKSEREREKERKREREKTNQTWHLGQQDSH